MRIRFLPLVLIALFSLSLFLASTGESQRGQLRHVVAFKFKEDATPEKIKEVETAFRGLQSKIPEIINFEMGTNVSPEGLNKGFTHCFILTFTSESDRDIYLEHPDHKAFGAGLGPVLADVFVVDFWAE
ncbi:MAG: Dabb family protein [Acidobacteriota bacterium]|nr:MAG: Dabb family protein [Acidobacteriota bacterium]